MGSHQEEDDKSGSSRPTCNLCSSSCRVEASCADTCHGPFGGGVVGSVQ